MKKRAVCSGNSRCRAEMAQVNLGDLLQQGQTAGAERQALQETLTQACQITHAMLDELEELRSTLG